MERNKIKLIVVSRAAIQELAPVLEQLFAQCGCGHRYAVCSFEQLQTQGIYGSPYLCLLDSRQDCLQMASSPYQFPLCVMNDALAEAAQAKATAPNHVLTYSTSSDHADFTAKNIRCVQEYGCAFEIVGIGIIGRIRLRTAEQADVKIALMSASVCIACGIPFADVLTSLNTLAVGA